MGEKPNQPFQLSFNAALKVEFQGSRVTSDGGLILVRELDERLGFSALIAQHLTYSWRGSAIDPLRWQRCGGLLWHGQAGPHAIHWATTPAIEKSLLGSKGRRQ